MKSIIYVLIWTVLFVCFGLYINFKILDFTDKYTNDITIVEKYIEDDNFDAAKQELISYSNSWHKERILWYMLLNHENFDSVCLYLNILDKSILVQDKSKCLEYIIRIKVTLENILESEKCDYLHIM
ncbi:MAG: DUF4363 family protein [Peptostreptococcaceae bacterium]